MLTDLFAPLGEEHQALVDALAVRYIQDGRWAVWQYIEGQLDRRGFDAETLIRTLPVVGERGPVGPSYALTWHDRAFLAYDSQPGLTMASALHVPALREIWEKPFLRFLNLLIDFRLDLAASPQEAREAMICRDDVLHAMPFVHPVFMVTLPMIMDHEPATWGGSKSAGQDGNWKRGIPREVFKYQGLSTLEEYVHVVEHRVLVAQKEYLSISEPSESDSSVPRMAVSSYVEDHLLAELGKKAATTSWRLDRLLGFLQELNSNFEAENPYSCCMLLRSIMDHTPPLFGAKTFSEVASSFPWPRTDKKYLKQLQDFRAVADDVLHRQAQQASDAIGMGDLPGRSCVNALLRGCIDAL